MDPDEIVYRSAKRWFCCIIDRDQKASVELMMNIIAMGPTPCLRAMASLSDTVDHFRSYLSDCAIYGVKNQSVFESAISRFYKSQKNGDRSIDIGDWETTNR